MRINRLLAMTPHSPTDFHWWQVSLGYRTWDQWIVFSQILINYMVKLDCGWAHCRNGHNSEVWRVTYFAYTLTLHCVFQTLVWTLRHWRYFYFFYCASSRVVILLCPFNALRLHTPTVAGYWRQNKICMGNPFPVFKTKRASVTSSLSLNLRINGKGRSQKSLSVLKTTGVKRPVVAFAECSHWKRKLPREKLVIRRQVCLRYAWIL